MDSQRIIDWTVENLRHLLAQNEQENLVLDYKASLAIGEWTDSKRNELAKDVSAFANAAGGTIVIGIGEEQHKPTILDDGVDTRLASKEAIESALRARVTPHIERLVIKEIPNPALPFFSYFVIGIPRSMRAPHMCLPFLRYYRRYNFECVPMEHYEIEDLRRRQTEPVLSFTCTLHPEGEILSTGLHPYRLEAGILNDGNVTAKDVLVRLYLPRALLGSVVWQPNGSHGPVTYNGQDMYRCDSYLRDGAGPIPIFPHDDQPYMVTRGTGRRIILHLPADPRHLAEQPHIIAHVFAENMHIRSFEKEIRHLLAAPDAHGA